MRFQSFGIRNSVVKTAVVLPSAVLAFAGVASAHPGHEGPSGAMHFVASPVHVAFIGAALLGGIALAFAARRAFARRAANANSQR